MTEDLVCTALQIGIYTRQPPKGLIMHTDRGSQYCSQQYQDLLIQHGIVCSMSHKGLCYDSVVMKRFCNGLMKSDIEIEIRFNAIRSWPKQMHALD